MWKIKGKYAGLPWEVIDFFDTEEEAITMLAEYRMAFGNGWLLKVVKGR